MSNGSLDDIIDIVHRKGDDDVTKNEVSNRYRFFFFIGLRCVSFILNLFSMRKRKNESLFRFRFQKNVD